MSPWHSTQRTNPSTTMAIARPSTTSTIARHLSTTTLRPIASPTSTMTDGAWWIAGSTYGLEFMVPYRNSILKRNESALQLLEAVGNACQCVLGTILSWTINVHINNQLGTSALGIGTWNSSLSSSLVDALRPETCFVLFKKFHTTAFYLTEVFCQARSRRKLSSPPRTPPCACQTYGIEYPTWYAGSHIQHFSESHRFALVLVIFFSMQYND